MTLVAGADGFKRGWFVVLHDIASGEIENYCVPSFTELLEAAVDAKFVAIDVPIGLLDKAVKGGRAADKAARQLLGPVRAASVFTPPIRAVLSHSNYETAKAASINSSSDRISLSRQAFGICDKIREVDELMTPQLQERVKEVHPELSFLELNKGQPLTHGKKSHVGFLERLALLQSAGFESVLDADAFDCDVPTDDVLDAYACCWTAGRLVTGEAERLPELDEDLQIDATKKLFMEIWR